jgi:hypothetical protein
MKKIFTMFLFLILLMFRNLFPAIEILKITEPPSEVKLYQPLFIDVILSGHFINPFDVNEIKITAFFRTPSDKKVSMPCFYFGEDKNGSVWKLRFTPSESGKYNYFFEIRNYKNFTKSKTYTIEVKESNQKGFIRLNKNTNLLFEFDNGEPFRGIGENVCWATNYEYYFKKLSKNGCNLVRIWMCPWNLYLEWTEPGLGKYNFENAAKLDSILVLAESYQIYIMLCFDYHGALQRNQGYFNENRWVDNPYNSSNRGPCSSKSDFFTNPAAKNYYKNRLNYIVARYSYSPHILAWEFWNEVNLTAGNRKDIVAWHQEMAAYLKNIDPNKHLVTTSFSGIGYPEIWEIAELDFSQTHHYGIPNFKRAFPRIIANHITKYNKPHVIGEFGVDYRGSKETIENDPDNIGIHNGLWTGFFSPTPILPLTWWWDEVIDRENLYFLFKAVTKFGEDIFNNADNIEILNIDAIKIGNNNLLTGGVKNNTRDVCIYPGKFWGKNEFSCFEITPNGCIENQESVPTYLYGKLKPEFRNPPAFKINYKYDGKFGVHVNRVSQNGLLKIYLDNKLVLTKTLPLGEGKGEWEKSEWKEKWKIFQGIYNKQYRIEVPAGSHEIRVENDGTDWIEISRYKFENCGIRDYPVIKLMGFLKDNNIFLWIKNNVYSWKNVKDNGLPQIIKNATISIPQLTFGDYKIEWWDTYLGKIFQVDHFSVNEKNYKLILPSFQKDVACKIIFLN